MSGVLNMRNLPDLLIKRLLILFIESQLDQHEYVNLHLVGLLDIYTPFWNHWYE